MIRRLTDTPRSVIRASALKSRYSSPAMCRQSNGVVGVMLATSAKITLLILSVMCVLTAWPVAAWGCQE